MCDFSKKRNFQMIRRTIVKKLSQQGIIVNNTDFSQSRSIYKKLNSDKDFLFSSPIHFILMMDSNLKIIHSMNSEEVYLYDFEKLAGIFQVSKESLLHSLFISLMFQLSEKFTNKKLLIENSLNKSFKFQ